MLERHEIRRREDGSIDIGFYRDAGLTERRDVIFGVVVGMTKAVTSVVTTVAAYVAGQFAAAPADRHTATV